VIDLTPIAKLAVLNIWIVNYYRMVLLFSKQ